LKLSDAVVCNDSGGMHLAAALGTPGVALFGITDPGVTGPLHNRMRVVRAEGPGPVSRRIQRQDARARRALESISVDRVLREVWMVLEGRDHD